jgi:hypothetical protein
MKFSCLSTLLILSEFRSLDAEVLEHHWIALEDVQLRVSTVAASLSRQ